MENFPFRIERLTEDRFPDMQRLQAEVLHQKLSLEYLRSKYDTRYLGTQYLGALAYDGDRAIAFYGAIPQAFTHPSGARMLGCHAADSMTLDAYQRRGIHQQLALTTYDWMRAEGISVVYCFHSDNTYHSCKKLGWKELGRLRGYWVEGAAWPTAKVYRRLPVLDAWQNRRVEKFLQKYTIDPRIFPNSNASLGWAVEYSPDYIASKQFLKHFLVELEGVKFWLSIDAVIRIGDAHFEHAAHFEQGLVALQRLARQLGYGQILFQTYKGSALDAALSAKRKGFDAWIVGYLDLVPGLDFTEYRPSYADQDSF